MSLESCASNSCGSAISDMISKEEAIIGKKHKYVPYIP